MSKPLIITSMVNAAEFAVKELGQIKTKTQILKFRDGFRYAWKDAEVEESQTAIDYRNRSMRLGALLGFTSFIMIKELKRQGHISSKSKI